eukprot:764498_1
MSYNYPNYQQGTYGTAQTQMYQPMAPVPVSYQPGGNFQTYDPSGFVPHTQSQPAATDTAPNGGHQQAPVGKVDAVNSAAAAIVQKLNRANSSWISLGAVIIDLLKQQNVSSFEELGVGQYRNVPVLRHLADRNREINAFIPAHVACRSITTLYDLQYELAQSYKKKTFEELGLGCLLYHPDVVSAFKPSSSLTVVPQLSSIDIASHLQRYRREIGFAQVEIPKFLKFVCDKEGVDDPYGLCVRIKGIGLYIRMTGENFHVRKQKHVQIREELTRSAEQEMVRMRSQAMVQLGALKMRMGNVFDDFVSLWRRRLSSSDFVESVAKLFDSLPSKKFTSKKTKVPHPIVRTVCQIVALYIRDCVPADSAIALGNEAPPGPSDSQSEHKDDEISPSVADFEVEAAIKQNLGLLESFDLESLAKLADIVCQGLNVGHFSELGHGSFLNFVAQREELTNLMQSSLHQRTAHTAPLSEVLAFISQCLNAASALQVATLDDSDPTGTQSAELINGVTRCIRAQYDLSDVDELRLGSVESLIGQARKSEVNWDGYARSYGPVLVEEFGDESVEDKDTSVSVGSIGSVTEAQLLRMLASAPYLRDLDRWCHWKAVAEKEHGDIGSFLKKHEDCENAISVLETEPGRFVRIDPSITPNSLLDIACGTAKHVQSAVPGGGGSTFAASNNYSSAAFRGHHTAVGLASVVCAHRSVHAAPLGLLRTHLQTALATMVGEEEMLLAFLLSVLTSLPVDLRAPLAERVLFPAAHAANFAHLHEKLLTHCAENLDGLEVLHGLGLELGVEEWRNSFNAVVFEPPCDTEKPTGSTDQSMQPAIVIDESAVVTSRSDILAHVAGTLKSEKETEKSEKSEKVGKHEVISLIESDDSSSDSDMSESSSDVSSDDEKEVLDLSTDGESECRRIVQDILFRQFGEGLELGPAAKEVFLAQTQRIGRALEGLSRELYSDESHFVLELVQNADDNTYPTDICPTLRFHVTSRAITLENNERGFSEKDIRALCDVGKSTKPKHAAGYIGQKGIGFKSVFRVTHAPEIHSNGFHVRFDASVDTIGYIKPLWILQEERPLMDKDSWNTRIHLPLFMSAEDSSLTAKFDDIDPNILLFLHRLRKIIVHDQIAGMTRTMHCIPSTTDNTVTIRHATFRSGRLGGDGPMKGASDGEMKGANGQRKGANVSRKDASDGQKKSVKVAEKRNSIEEEEHDDVWMVIKKTFEPKVLREGVAASEISLAFPMHDEGDDLSEPLPLQKMFAFLPLRSYGFRFVINADWIVPSSREAVDSSNLWNEWLRSELAGLFIEALESFKTHHRADPLRATAHFLRFVPMEGEITGTFFRPVAREIRGLLKRTRCLPTQSGTWSMPHGVLLPPNSEMIASLVSPELLRDSLGKDFLAAHVSLPVALQRALGVAQFGAAHLLEVLEAVAKRPGGISAQPSQWGPQMLYVLFQLVQTTQTSHQRPGAASKRSGSFLEPALLSKLKSLRFLNLSNGKFSSLNDGTIFFPFNVLGGQRHAAMVGVAKALDVFSNELRILDSKFMNLGSGSGSDEQHVMGGQVLHSTVRYVLEQMGVRHLSTHDLVYLHLLPALKKPDVTSKPQNTLNAYCVYLKLHLEQCAKCRMGGKLVKELKDCLIVHTNNGPKPVSSQLHFPSAMGNKFGIDKLISAGVSWNMIDTGYLTDDTGSVASWRGFFKNFGATDFVSVNEVETKVENQGTSPWRAEDWEMASGPYIVKDFASIELEDMLPVLEGDPSILRLVAMTFDELWTTQYSRFASAHYHSRENAHARGTTPSSFVLRLRNARWMPAVESPECYAPSKLFVRSTELFNIFESNIKYVDATLKNPKFIADMGIHSMHTLTPQLVIDILEGWATDMQFEPVGKQLIRIYKYLARHMDNAGVREAVRQLAAQYRIIFVPRVGSSMDKDAFMSGEMYTSSQVVINDPTDTVDSYGVRVLCKWPQYYHDAVLQQFFMGAGVRGSPNTSEYVTALLALCQQTGVREGREQALKVLAYWGSQVRRMEVSAQQIDLLLRGNHVSIFPSEDDWVSLDQEFYLNDDLELTKHFRKFEGLRFITLPKERSTADEIEHLLNVLNVPRVSTSVSCEPVTEYVQFGTVLGAFLAYNMKYIQRWIYNKHSALYTTLVSNNIAQRLSLLTFSVAQSVHVRYRLGSFESDAVPAACVLEQGAELTSLVVRKKDIRRYAQIYGELSRLFFGKRCQPMANFLHILTETQRTYAEEPEELEERVEELCSSEQISALPDHEQPWEISQQLAGPVSQADVFQEHQLLEEATDDLLVFQDIRMSSRRPPPDRRNSLAPKPAF